MKEYQNTCEKGDKLSSMGEQPTQSTGRRQQCWPMAGGRGCWWKVPCTSRWRLGGTLHPRWWTGNPLLLDCSDEDERRKEQSSLTFDLQWPVSVVVSSFMEFAHQIALYSMLCTLISTLLVCLFLFFLSSSWFSYILSFQLFLHPLVFFIYNCIIIMWIKFRPCLISCTNYFLANNLINWLAFINTY